MAKPIPRDAPDITMVLFFREPADSKSKGVSVFIVQIIGMSLDMVGLGRTWDREESLSI
jgi:hypothetical protein